jgi:hypothetical protein
MSMRLRRWWSIVPLESHVAHVNLQSSCHAVLVSMASASMVHLHASIVAKNAPAKTRVAGASKYIAVIGPHIGSHLG